MQEGASKRQDDEQKENGKKESAGMESVAVNCFANADCFRNSTCELVSNMGGRGGK